MLRAELMPYEGLAVASRRPYVTYATIASVATEASVFHVIAAQSCFRVHPLRRVSCFGLFARDHDRLSLARCQNNAARGWSATHPPTHGARLDAFRQGRPPCHGRDPL